MARSHHALAAMLRNKYKTHSLCSISIAANLASLSGNANANALCEWLYVRAHSH